jgi:hypothetical protein
MVSDFSACAKTSFGYLVEELDFSLVDDSWHGESASWVVSYLSSTRSVELVWGLKDTQFYFSVRRVLENGQVEAYSEHGIGMFYIFELPLHLEPGRYAVEDFDIGSGPIREQLEEKVKLNAEVLRRHGWEILQGNLWYDSNAGVMVGGRV